MTDVFTPKKRSEVMAKIRGRRNKDTELVLIQIFRKHRISGWRRDQPFIGKPDFTFSKEKIVVFVDGCFWHRCPKHSNIPVNNRSFWIKKLNSNKTRDRLVSRRLRKDGWLVIRIWEHDLGNAAKVVKTIKSALAMRG